MIRHVAVKIGDVVHSLPKPNRHRNIYDMLPNLPKQSGFIVGGVDGFLDAKGRFLTREQALDYAISVGQIKEPQWDENKLFSEDLW